MDSQSTADYRSARGRMVASRRHCFKYASSIEDMLQAQRTGPTIRQTMAASGLRAVASLELLARWPKKQKVYKLHIGAQSAVPALGEPRKA